MNEQYADMLFPTSGVDLSYAFGAQRPDSTRQGVNVRVYEPAERRARGGARAGLSQYIPAPVAAHVIQHLNAVVDPRAEALPWYDPPAEADGPGVAGGANPLQAGPNGDGTYTDPYGFLVRYGGTGIRRSTRRLGIRFIQQTSDSFIVASPSDVKTLAFVSNVVAGHLLLAAVFNYGIVTACSITDSQGNTWALASQSGLTGTVANGVGIFYAIANLSQACTVSLHTTSASLGVDLCILEYGGVDILTPLTGTSTNSATGTAVTTGSVTVGGTGAMVLGAINYGGIHPFTRGSGFTMRQGGAANYLLVEDRIGLSSDLAATGTFATAATYRAVGTGWRRAVS